MVIYSSTLVKENVCSLNEVKTTRYLFMSPFFYFFPVLFCFPGQFLNYSHVRVFTLLKQSHYFHLSYYFCFNSVGEAERSRAKPNLKIYIWKFIVLWFWSLLFLTVTIKDKQKQECAEHFFIKSWFCKMFKTHILRNLGRSQWCRELYNQETDQTDWT